MYQTKPGWKVVASCPTAHPTAPFSTTSNVTGILTWVLGVVWTCLVLLAATYNAPQEIRDYEASLAERQYHIQKIDRFVQELIVGADLQMESELRDLLTNAIREAKSYQEGLLGKVREVKGSRLQWWFRRQGMASSMTRLETQMQHLSGLQLTFLLS